MARILIDESFVDNLVTELKKAENYLYRESVISVSGEPMYGYGKLLDNMTSCTLDSIVDPNYRHDTAPDTGYGYSLLYTIIRNIAIDAYAKGYDKGRNS